MAAELDVEPHRVHTARSRVLKQLRQEIGAVAVRQREEFDDNCWEIFRQVAVDGAPVADVASSAGLDPQEVSRVAARVLRRLRDVGTVPTS